MLSLWGSFPDLFWTRLACQEVTMLSGVTFLCDKHVVEPKPQRGSFWYNPLWPPRPQMTSSCALFLSSYHPLPSASPFQAHLAHHRTHQRASHTGASCLHFLPCVLLPPCPSESVSNVTLLRKPLLMNLFKMAFSYPSLLAFNSNFLLRIFYDLDLLTCLLFSPAPIQA